MTTTIVFAHGAWVTPACWDRFIARYEARGHRCIAPAWPFDDRPVQELRRNPARELAGIGVVEIVDHYARVIADLGEPPIIIGHSFGGLFTQMLLDRGLGAAGVAIDPAPPRGVLAGPRAIASSSSVLRRWRAWKKVLTMSLPTFRATFTNGMSDEEQRQAYDEHVVPTPGRVFFQAAFGAGTRVNFRNDARAPLLITAGGRDVTVTPGMCRATARKHRRSPSVTDFVQFPGRPHWLIASPGWEGVADQVLEWAEEHARSSN
ncbi:MAG: alpha/beta hydrolase [Actinobacteria bacterium]|nr:alpha/beta hydrolase [Actinomycetota bacterium]